MMYDTLIRNALVIDGSNVAGYPADVAIRKGRIERIGDLHDATASEEINQTLLHIGDLAEQALEGLVRATAYRATEAMSCRVAVADVWSDGGERIDQLLHGEIFDVLDRSEGRAWGRARRDGVVGWMAAEALSPGAPDVDRRVISTSGEWPLNAFVSAGESVAGGTVPVGDFEADPVAVAERLLGVPHSLGARSSAATAWPCWSSSRPASTCCTSARVCRWMPRCASTRVKRWRTQGLWVAMMSASRLNR